MHKYLQEQKHKSKLKRWYNYCQTDWNSWGNLPIVEIAYLNKNENLYTAGKIPTKKFQNQFSDNETQKSNRATQAKKRGPGKSKR